MWVFRILSLLLLMSLCLSAQSSPDKSSLPPPFEISVLTAPPEFQSSPSAPSQNEQKQIGTVPFETPLEPSPSDEYQIPGEPFPRPEATSICFYIRTYRVKRDQAQPDITTPAGYSECQPDTGLELKSVVDSPRLIFP
jgi:hypothetical protein